MNEDNEHLLDRIDELEQEVDSLRDAGRRRCIRKCSTETMWGLPLYDIAFGPNPDNDEVRGHARGFIALGDVATGVVAMGGIARGLLALGGLALGVVSLGGCSVGILAGVGGLGIGALAVGGAAIGGIAVGGAAVGVVAVGGAALGYYACGGGAFGEYVISAMRRDPEAVQFFSQWNPGLRPPAP